MNRVINTLLLMGATALGQIDNPPTSASILDATAVGRSLLTASNAEAARTSIGALATNGSAVGLTNFPTVPLASNITGTIAISNGGSGATTAGGARTNLGLGATWLTNTIADAFRGAIGLGPVNSASFADVMVGIESQSYAIYFNLDGVYLYEITSDEYQPVLTYFYDQDQFSFYFPIGIEAHVPISFANTNASAATRTNLGLGLPALTNTSNVTMMRALAGSTNTNHPFTGGVEFSNGPDQYSATFSNGILLDITGPF